LRYQYVNEFFDVDQYVDSVQAGRKKLHFFEKTPSYMRVPGVAAKVYRILGRHVKIVTILRNPVHRMYSQYAMDFNR
jgi:hypothetical protein